ncbi:hypothetical protein [Nocardia blacklockiae]|uniref:hypothetical protein n=1 Tax=Nocardia blacklockiae TaxID=480036 RepID=UPI0018962A42|nr:hypothetical protein [Nocardia blacklockiae]MBF6175652.1 hypothetical protein [Nocardia blacklockiae]
MTLADAAPGAPESPAGNPAADRSSVGVPELLADLAGRLTPGCDPATVRAVLRRACGGQLVPLGPDGHRASTLVKSGLPFEASVSGGRGEVAPVVRYSTETATQETRFAVRLAAQRAAIGDLVAWLPGGDRTVVESLRSFVDALYPEPATIPARYRSATWIGVVHHPAAPHGVAGLKVYGSPLIAPGAMRRLAARWPEFAELATVPDDERLVRLAGAALEVDARGTVKCKLYYQTRYADVGVPMKLVRYFGDPAWEVLSEFVRCGVDAAELHRHRFFVGCARTLGAAAPSLGMHLFERSSDDMPRLVRELAVRHHGTTRAVDALADAARATGASWRYSGAGLGFSDRIDKLNVYGTPTWPAP